MDMEINIKRDLNETYLVLPEGEMNEVAYRIMSDRPQAHLMKPKRIPDGGCAFAAGGGNTLEHRYRNENMTLSDVRRLFYDLELAFVECRNCMLLPENMILRPQLIVERDGGTFVFIAHPGISEDLFAGLRRLVNFCRERFAGTDEELAVISRLGDKSTDEMFGFDELLCVLSRDPSRKKDGKEETEASGSDTGKAFLLLPAALLAASFSFFALYCSAAEGGPRMLLGSFVCLMTSAGCMVSRTAGPLLLRRNRKSA